MVAKIKYNVFRKRNILITFTVLIIISILLTFSLSLISSIIRGVELYTGGSQGSLIIFSNRSSTPFTGILDLSMINELSRVPGVKYISPELPVPVYLNDSPIVLRGVDPNVFMQCTPIRVLKGFFLNEDDYNGVVLGETLADKMNVDIGSKILVTGVLTKMFQPMIVKGIIRAPYPYDSEALVIIDEARYFRGIYGNYSSMIRVIVDSKDKESVREYIQNIIYNTSISSSAYVSTPSSSVNYYLRKYGFTLDTLLIALIPSVLLSIYSVKYLVVGLLEGNMDIILLLHGVGFSINSIKYFIGKKLLILTIASSIVGSIIGFILLKIIWIFYNIRFLVYIPLYFPWYIPLLTFIFLYITQIIYLSRGNIGDEI